MNSRIMLVDDEEALRESLGELLKHDAYELSLVESGDDAINLLNDAEFDLVLLDLMMPDMSGVEVLRWINRHVPSTKVIFLTGHGSLESAIEALRYGAHDYLLKPASAQEILQSIHSALAKDVEWRSKSVYLRRAETSKRYLRDVESIKMDPDIPTESIRIFEDIYLDVMRREIRSSSQRVALTPAEARLLKVLLQNRGKVLTHRELVFLVQGYETTDWEAPMILRPLISRLRRKLSTIPGGEKWITNVRGTGYLFEAETG